MNKIYFIKAIALLSMVAALFLVSQTVAQNQAYLGARNPATSQMLAEKPIIDYTGKYLPPSGREGGETIATAIPVASLPFNDTGNTCDNVNNYDEVCPYSGSTAPDVVYSYSPTENLSVDIDLCGSSYDTKIYVYLNVAGNVVACNDDYYYDPTCGNYTSLIVDLLVTAGNTYYIVVDGYGGACGSYILNISGEIPVYCSACLDCSGPEGEPDIPNEGVDVTNGGCNMTQFGLTPLWTPIQLNQTICGRTNTYVYQNGTYRDTDWYEITLEEGGTLYVSGIAPFSMQLLLIYAADCISPQYISGSTSGCDILTLSATVSAGTYWIWAGPTFFEGMPQGANYNFVVTLNEPPVGGLCVESVPIADWPLYLAAGLIALAVAFRFWRRS
jgi:hypothetical protein